MEVMKFAPLMGWFKNKNIKPNDPLIGHDDGEKCLMKDMKVVKGMTRIKQPKEKRNASKKRQNRKVEAIAEKNMRKARKIQEEVVEDEENNLSHHQDENIVNNLFSSSIDDEPIVQPKEVNHVPDDTSLALPNSSDNDEQYDQMQDGDQNEDGIEDQNGIEENDPPHNSEDDTTYSYERAVEYLDVLPYSYQLELVHFANDISDDLFKESHTEHFLDLDDAAIVNMY